MTLVVIWMIAGVDAAKPKQKGFVQGAAGAFKSTGIEEIMVYSDLDRDGR